MNVLSLFDGMAGCRIALDRLGITPTKYYASEIDKYAMQVANHNYPSIIQLGSVADWEYWRIDWSSIDLVTGGFPCQAWSIAGKQKGDRDERGKLFWTMLHVMKMVMIHNPKAKFMIENVKMKKEFEEYITYHTEQALGHVNKILINSALVSAQNRNRYYWTNIDGVEQPDDLGLVLADVIESGYVDRDKSLTVTTRVACATARRCLEKSMHQMVIERPCEPREYSDDSLLHCVATATDIKGHDYNKRVYATTGKAPTLVAASGGNLEPKVLCGSIIGRKINPDTGKRDDYNPDVKTEQRLEIRSDEKTGTLTTVRKDNVIVRLGNVNPSGNGMNGNVYHTRGLSPTLTTNKGEGLKISDSDKLSYRKLTPLECERLQTLPDNYTLILDENGKQLVSNTQRYKMLGNGFTVEVIRHILSCNEWTE